MNPTVAVVLGYYEGLDYLGAQLRTIFDQIEVDVEVFLFDDCSPSGEIDINLLGLSVKDLNRLHIIRREANLGFSKNFLLGLSECPDSFDFYAYSDQDDLWDADKLIVAIRELEKRSVEVPVLYCSRTRIVGECGEGVKGLSPLFKKTPSFAGSLVQNIGGGNTMVFNGPAMSVINEFSTGVQVVSHDWWSYIAVTAVGGDVVYDTEPHLSYRQHGKNVIGANRTLSARIKRVYMLYNGRFKFWNDIHCIALENKRGLLTKENVDKFDSFIFLRSIGGFKAMYGFIKIGISRQTIYGQIALLIGLLLRRI